MPVTDASLPAELFQQAQADGGDLRFSADAAGETRLACEIVAFEPGSPDAGQIWVKLPDISQTADTTFYVWWGHSETQSQPAADEDFGRNAVWSNGFVAVWHLEESASATAGEYADSTGNGNDGQGGAGNATQVPSRAAGQIGFGQHCDRSADEHIHCGTASNIRRTGDFSFECWAQFQNDLSNNQKLMTWASFQSHGVDFFNNFGQLAVDTNQSGASQRTATAFGAVTTGTWYHLVATRSGPDARVYVNGQDASDSAEQHSDPTTNGTPFRLSSTFNALDGVLDEARVHTVARSPAWVATSYECQADPQSFVTAGEPESPEVPPVEQNEAALAGAAFDARVIRRVSLSEIGVASGATASQIDPATAIDFSDYASDAAPHDWTAHGGAGFAVVRDRAGAIGGKVLEVDPESGDGRRALLWDGTPAASDQEVLMRLRRTATGRVDARPWLRALDTDNGYGALWDSDLDLIDIGKIVNGSFTSIASDNKTNDFDDWYWIRFRAEGAMLRAKFWPDSEAEPEAWDLTASDSDLNDGRAGFFSFRDTALEVDIWSLGSGGTPAPSPEGRIVGQLSESATASAVFAARAVRRADLRDSAVLTDTETAVMRAVATVEELGQATDTSERSPTIDALLSAAADASEEVEGLLRLAAVLEEGAASNTGIAARLDTLAALIEAAVVGDVFEGTAIPATVASAAVSEAGLSSTEMTARCDAVPTLTESAQASEALSANVIGRLACQVFEQGHAGDVIRTHAEALARVTGAATASDALTAALVTLATVTEPGTAEGLYSAARTGAAHITDEGWGGDTTDATADLAGNVVAAAQAGGVYVVGGAVRARLAEGAVAGDSYGVKHLGGFVVGAISIAAALAGGARVSPAVSGTPRVEPGVTGATTVAPQIGGRITIDPALMGAAKVRAKGSGSR